MGTIPERGKPVPRSDAGKVCPTLLCPGRSLRLQSTRLRAEAPHPGSRDTPMLDATQSLTLYTLARLVMPLVKRDHTITKIGNGLVFRLQKAVLTLSSGSESSVSSSSIPERRVAISSLASSSDVFRPVPCRSVSVVLHASHAIDRVSPCHTLSKYRATLWSKAYFAEWNSF
jgi:hypothetical protein